MEKKGGKKMIKYIEALYHYFIASSFITINAYVYLVIFSKENFILCFILTCLTIIIIFTELHYAMECFLKDAFVAEDKNDE